MSEVSSADGIWRRLPFWVALATGFVVSLASLLSGISRGWSVIIALTVATFLFLILSADRPKRASDEMARRQRMRSLAIGLGLGFLVIVFYAATIIRLGPNALRHDGRSPSSAQPIEGAADLACKKAGTC